MKKIFAVLFVIAIVAMLIIAAVFINSTDHKKKSNKSPLALIDSPKNDDIFSINDEIAFDGSSSTDPEGKLLSYTWSSNISGDFGYEGNLNHNLDAGVHEIMLTVTDNKGKENFTIIRILVYPLPSVIIDSPLFNSEYYSTELILFNGSNSSSQYSSNVNFTWTSDLDGVLGHSKTLSTNLTIGYHTITLKVDDGLSTSQEQLIVEIKENHAPTATIKSPKYNDLFQVTEEILFDGTDCTDPDDHKLYYNWTSNLDGHIGIEMMFSTGLSAGIHIITLEINDGYGCSSEESIVVTINTQPIAIAGNNITVNIGERIMFDGSNSSDPDGDDLIYSWDFGDGNESFGKKAYHTYQKEGFYNVTLRVNDGKKGFDIYHINVEAIYVFRGPGICGYVYDNLTKKPVKGIYVNAEQWDWYTYYYNYSITNDTGYFELITPKGYIDLFISPNTTYYSYYAEIHIDENEVENEIIYLDRIPPQTSKVFGYVYDEDTNEPISGVEIELDGYGGGSYNNTFSDDNGYYEMYSYAGEFELYCLTWYLDKDYEFYSKDITLFKDQSLEVDIYLVPELPTEINITFEFHSTNWNLVNMTTIEIMNSYTEDMRYYMDKNDDGKITEAEVTVSELERENYFNIDYFLYYSNGTFMVDDITFAYIEDTVDIEIHGAVGSTDSTSPITTITFFKLQSNEIITNSNLHDVQIEVEYDMSHETHIYFIKFPSNFKLGNHTEIENITVTGSNLVMIDPLGQPEDEWFYWYDIILEAKRN
jgi:hypothetical protein